MWISSTPYKIIAIVPRYKVSPVDDKDAWMTVDGLNLTLVERAAPETLEAPVQRKPTIEELEKILNCPGTHKINLSPDGGITSTACELCDDRTDKGAATPTFHPPVIEHGPNCMCLRCVKPDFP